MWVILLLGAIYLFFEGLDTLRFSKAFFGSAYLPVLIGPMLLGAGCLYGAYVLFPMDNFINLLKEFSS